MEINHFNELDSRWNQTLENNRRKKSTKSECDYTVEKVKIWKQPKRKWFFISLKKETFEEVAFYSCMHSTYKGRSIMKRWREKWPHNLLFGNLTCNSFNSLDRVFSSFFGFTFYRMHCNWISDDNVPSCACKKSLLTIYSS